MSVTDNVKEVTCLAVLASFNRRELTLKCIESTHRAAKAAGIKLVITLCDDGSADGTAHAVLEQFPETRIIHGDGFAYWVGGMRQALSASEDLINVVDYLLFLNDDTTLYEDAFSSLVVVHPTARAIVVGTVVDPESGLRTYGGYLHSITRGRVQQVPVDQHASAAVDTFNCNAVLITIPAYRMLGGFDSRFTHCMADIDMGLRARDLGISSNLGLRIVGECQDNPGKEISRDRNLTVKKRISAVIGPKEFPPKEWFVFTRRHYGPIWPLYFVSPYVRALGLRR